ncbi:MAG: hypothetical protein KDC80_22460 [Saprospiraceae bacterium]|nr:hypothetical protein [Saprospiraceae bacterium]
MMELTAGKIKVTYDRGFLRYIKVGNYEVLRMIYFALRDRNWDTMSGRIESEKITTREQGFSISYRWISTHNDFPFEWDVRIEGNDDSQILFSIRGEAKQDVLKNRTGFCILHSVPENAGGPCTIITPEGEQIEGHFPRFISPHQPFFNITSMRWPLAKLGEAILEFEGDVFETEDQRNWTDDSYKTYCTPLAIPFPAALKKGQVVRQTVRLQIASLDNPVEENHNEEICVLTPETAITTKPRIGIGAPESGSLAPSEYNQLKEVEFDHYRVEVHFSDAQWQESLDQRIREALGLKLDVEMWLFFSDNEDSELTLFINYLDQLPAETRLFILILHDNHKTTPPALVQKVIPPLRKLNRSVKIGAGTAAYFTELNRERVDTRGLDFVNYSINPQVHAFDDPSLVENSYAQAYTVESCRHYFPGQEIHVSPITLKPRFNPNATSEASPSMQDLPDNVDPRQMSLFGAGWTISSLLSLTKAGSDMLTYYQCTGWKGIIQGDKESPMPDKFAAKMNMLFPVYHVLKCMLDHKGADWLPFKSSHPLKVVSIGFREKNKLRILIANLQSISADVKIKYPSSKFKLFHYNDNNLADSYFDVRYLEKNLEKCSVQTGANSGFKIAAHAIVYAELYD